MYNFTKLLLEEPKKLERLFIIFFKLLVTFYIVGTYFKFNISLPEFVANPILQNYSLTKLILFLIYIVIIWYVIWSLLAELLLGDLLIWLLSKRKPNKNSIMDFLSFLKVVKKEYNTFIPAKNVILFNSILHEYSDEDERFLNESKSRIRQYYLVSTILYILFLFADDIIFPTWLKLVSGIIITLYLYSNIVTNQIHEYFKENLEEMKKQFSSLAYAQMVLNAIEQNAFLRSNYEKGNNWNRIRLKRKTELESLPELIKFHPTFYWNKELTKLVISKGLETLSQKSFPSDKIGKHYNVIVSNIQPNHQNIKNILSQPGLVYLHCENEEEIFKNIEVFLFKVTNGFYSIN